ncbi:DUF134 domain-containing protein [Sporosalibacterium faouarense]|uniref:DUF134 domain-containing protein n=1 Tax=Sporosalibacterium faouarense TaxID=516123 RepID=UPI00311CCD71
MSNIARPRKCRRVAFIPENKHFIPLENQGNKANEVILKVEEVEAIRLKDFQNLSQEDCAKKMEISRQTFQNIIGSARRKIAEALIEGKSIKIYGGNYHLKPHQKRCRKCQKEFGNDQEREKFCIHKCDIKEAKGENKDE